MNFKEKLITAKIHAVYTFYRNETQDISFEFYRLLHSKLAETIEKRVIANCKNREIITNKGFDLSNYIIMNYIRIHLDNYGF